MKKNIKAKKLADLKVESFVTSEAAPLKGGFKPNLITYNATYCEC